MRILEGNFGKSLVIAASAIMARIELTTEQKHYITSAIDQLESSNQSNVEEMVLGVLQAILPERLPIQTQSLPNDPNPFNPET